MARRALALYSIVLTCSEACCKPRAWGCRSDSRSSCVCVYVVNLQDRWARLDRQAFRVRKAPRGPLALKVTPDPQAISPLVPRPCLALGLVVFAWRWHGHIQGGSFYCFQPSKGAVAEDDLWRLSMFDVAQSFGTLNLDKHTVTGGGFQG